LYKSALDPLPHFFLVVLLQVEDSHFSLIVISFHKSANAASDAILAVMTSCFTPAARAASRMRVVPETADWKRVFFRLERDNMRTWTRYGHHARLG
jgi:hypothetical protein